VNKIDPSDLKAVNNLKPL
jgi:hypothetical protein